MVFPSQAPPFFAKGLKRRNCLNLTGDFMGRPKPKEHLDLLQKRIGWRKSEPVRTRKENDLEHIARRIEWRRNEPLDIQTAEERLNDIKTEVVAKKEGKEEEVKRILEELEANIERSRAELTKSKTVGELFEGLEAAIAARRAERGGSEVDSILKEFEENIAKRRVKE